MQRAAQEAREGNLQYIQDLPAEDLERLIKQTDEDGRQVSVPCAHGCCNSEGSSS